MAAALQESAEETVHAEERAVLTLRSATSRTNSAAIQREHSPSRKPPDGPVTSFIRTAAMDSFFPGPRPRRVKKSVNKVLGVIISYLRVARSGESKNMSHVAVINKLYTNGTTAHELVSACG